MSWKPKTIGDFLALQRGHDLTEEERTPGTVPIIGSAGQNGFHGVARAKGPGVTVGRSGGSIGKITFVPEDYWPHNTCLYVTDFKGNDQKFAYYLLKTQNLAVLNSGAAQPSLNRNFVYGVKIRAPEHSEQVRVAEILSTYDELIINNERRIALLERSARLLFEEWFVRLRYPGHKDVGAGECVPVGWENSTVGEVCTEFSDGDWLETKDQGGDALRILQISNIGNNEFIETNNFRFISDETFKRLHCNEINPGDILISRMPTPVGRAWLVFSQEFRMVTAVDVTIARTNQDMVDSYYFLYHLNSERHIARCEAAATGATRQRIAKRVLAALPILIPPLELQKRFGAITRVGNELRHSLMRQNRCLTRARDLFLHRLMDGRIAV